MLIIYLQLSEPPGLYVLTKYNIFIIEVILTPHYDRVKPRTFIFTDHSSGLLLYLNILYYSDFYWVASCISLALFDLSCYDN